MYVRMPLPRGRSERPYTAACPAAACDPDLLNQLAYYHRVPFHRGVVQRDARFPCGERPAQQRIGFGKKEFPDDVDMPPTGRI